MQQAALFCAIWGRSLSGLKFQLHMNSGAWSHCFREQMLYFMTNSNSIWSDSRDVHCAALVVFCAISNRDFKFLLQVSKCKNSPKVYWRPLHVYCCDFEWDGFDFCQEVEVHEVFLAENASSLPPPVDGWSLDDELDLRNRTWRDRLGVHSFKRGGLSILRALKERINYVPLMNRNWTRPCRV